MAGEIDYSSDGVVRPNVGTFCTAAEGKTRQEDAVGTDINVLLKRGEAAIVPQLREGGFFADVSQIGDLHDCLDKVRRASEVFSALPAEVRSAFENKPELFTEAFANPEGLAKLRELKIVAELPEVVLEQQEAAAETRAMRRTAARQLGERVEAAKVPPVSK